ncbi:uncharacterized protein LOC130524288 isoform X1 [Takifugu flavidus]|uniref:uncharacterized protein LOC130524288 isoform X1 n=1 Tax=Takifugu flavidus TaxID=433684 RepID=UPI0025447A37|nr:uncharacterized protein LOC130524288 isoform X1 [Takifugu flavidus]
MAPQLYVTMYKEQFASPGRVKREELRPTSAHRRNNPQPRPDFLFPRSLQAIYSQHRAVPQQLPPVDTDRPFFPPVKHLSFQGPVTTCPGRHLKAVNTGKPVRMPSVNLSMLQALPSVGGVQKLQLTDPAGLKLQEGLRSPSRSHAPAAQLKPRPQSSSLPPAPRNLPQIQFQRFGSKSRLDYSTCHSCFHVVKPFQAGHYIIHPEFVSEVLR